MRKRAKRIRSGSAVVSILVLVFILALAGSTWSSIPEENLPAVTEDGGSIEEAVPESAALDGGGMAPLSGGSEPDGLAGSGAPDQQDASAAFSVAGSGSVGPRGNFSYGVPMAAPPGRAGLSGRAGVSYSSGGLSDFSLAGYGWDTPMSAIRRSTRYGVNHIYDTYEFFGPGDGELVDVDTNGFWRFSFGYSTIQPTPADFDGDGTIDVAGFDSANDTFYWIESSSGEPGSYQIGPGGSLPVPGDYDGDGTTDPAVFVPSSGNWQIQQSTAGYRVQQWGTSSMTPVPADYDGDGATDIAIYDPTPAGWHLLQSTAGYRYQQYGWSAVKPVPADYDADGKADIAVFYQPGGNWYIRKSSTGTDRITQLGYSLTDPVPADYDGDGYADPAVYLPSSCAWYVKNKNEQVIINGFIVPGSPANSEPAPSDYDGDGTDDMCVYGPGTTSQYVFYREPSGNDTVREHRPVFEGSYNRYFYDTANNSWTVYDQSGTKMTYGGTAASRMSDPSDSSRVFAWYLEEVRDIHDNYVKYVYYKDSGAIYPKEIKYTGHGTTDGLLSIRFQPFYDGPSSANRSDITVSYASGFKVERKYRVEKVLTYADGDLATRYDLAYEDGYNGTRSVLKSVTRYGHDNSSSLPPVTFEYHDPTFPDPPPEDSNYVLPTGYFTVGMMTLQTNEAPTSDAVRFADVNGDGLTDMLYANGCASGFIGGAGKAKEVWLNTGSGWLLDTNWVIPEYKPIGVLDRLYFVGFLDEDQTPDPMGVQLTDLNGDGKVDILLAQHYLYEGVPVERKATWINNGSGWTRDDRWNLASGYAFVGSYTYTTPTIDVKGIIDMGVRMPDLNGDGLPDLVYAATCAYGKFTSDNLVKGRKIWLNTGSGWAEDTTWTLPLTMYFKADLENDGSYFPDDGALRFADVNGDGLPDLLYGNGHKDDYHSGAPAETKWAWLNTGAGWQLALPWAPKEFFIDNLYWWGQDGRKADDTGTRLYDANADGLVDIVYSRWYYNHDYGQWFKQQGAWINTSTGWVDNADYEPGHCMFVGSTPIASRETMVDTGIQIVDVNADRAPELIYARNISFSDYRIPQGYKAYQGIDGDETLLEVANGLGGKTEITYEPSALTSGYDAPFTYNIVTELHTFDGLGADYTSRYEYADAWFYYNSPDPHKNEYRGFHKVTAIDSTGAKVCKYYHQGGGVDGSANGEYQDHKSKAGRVYRTEVYGNDEELYASSVTKWDHISYVPPQNPSVWQYRAKAIESVSFSWEGLSQSRETASRTFYDDKIGVPTNTISLGEVNANPATGAITDIMAGDELYTVMEYTTFANEYIKGLPSRVAVYADESMTEKLSETLFGYKSSSMPEYSANWLDTTGGYVTNGVIVAYDTYGNPTSAKDAIGVETETTYDSAYHAYPVEVDTDGMVTRSSFDERSGQVLGVVNPLDVAVTNYFDVFFRPTKSERDGIWVQEIAYTLGGISGGAPNNKLHVKANVGSNTPGDGIAETWSYFDGLGRAVQTRVESERAGQYRVGNSVLDEHGRVVYQYEPYFQAGGSYVAFSPSSPVVTYAYDPLNRVVSATPRTGDPDSPTAPTTTAYKDGSDPWARVVTDPLGKSRKVYSDAYGRSIKVVDYLDSVPVETEYRYDALGRMTNTVDPNDNVIHVSLDSLGRKTRMDDPDMGVSYYYYDHVGRMTNQTDAKGQAVAFDYTDHLGRLKTKRVYDDQGALVDTIQYFYDGSDDSAFTVYTGQLYKVTQNAAVSRHSYDVYGKILKTEVDIAGQDTYVISNTYDDLDRPITATYPNGVATIEYKYGPVGNLESVESLSGVGAENVTFYQVDSFNELGQVEQVTYGNGIESTFAYYSQSRRMKQTVTQKSGGGQGFQDLTYKYHANGYIKDILDNLRSDAEAATYTDIQYDDLYRLKSITRYDADSEQNQAFTYAYDVLGNITRNDDYSPTNTYTYTNPRPHALSTIGTNNFAYDDIGNMTNSLGRVLEYDARNRLQKVTTDDGTVAEFSYLDSGARFLKQVAANGETNTTLYVGDIYEDNDGEVLCHVFFGGKRIASFTPFEEQQQASALFSRFARAIDPGQDAQWTRSLPPLWGGGPWRSYLTRAPSNSKPLLHTLYALYALGLFLLLLWPAAVPTKRARMRTLPLPLGERIRGEGASFARRLRLLFTYTGTGLNPRQHGYSALSLLFITPRPSTLDPLGRRPRFFRAVALLLIFAMFFGMVPPVARAQAVYPRGDVNGDEVVDLADAMLIQQVVKSLRSVDDPIFDTATYANGDVNYDGATNATDAKIIAEYVVGQRDSLPDPPAGSQSLQFLYYHSDHLGSSNIITDREGELVYHSEYTPFGEFRHELNLGISINHLYTGQEYDREIGLYYYRARYYDSKIGRFISPDTIIPDPGDSQAYNRYAYVHNNPIMFTDPSGYWSITVGPVTVGDDGVDVSTDAEDYILPTVAVPGDDSAGDYVAEGAEESAEFIEDTVESIERHTRNEIQRTASNIHDAVPPTIRGGIVWAIPFSRELMLLHPKLREDALEHIKKYKAQYAAQAAATLAAVVTGGAVGTETILARFATAAAAGAASGGVGAALAGGDFWEGAAIGAATGLVTAGVMQAASWLAGRLTATPVGYEGMVWGREAQWRALEYEGMIWGRQAQLTALNRYAYWGKGAQSLARLQALFRNASNSGSVYLGADTNFPHNGWEVATNFVTMDQTIAPNGAFNNVVTNWAGITKSLELVPGPGGPLEYGCQLLIQHVIYPNRTNLSISIEWKPPIGPPPGRIMH